MVDPATAREIISQFFPYFVFAKSFSLFSRPPLLLLCLLLLLNDERERETTEMSLRENSLDAVSKSRVSSRRRVKGGLDDVF